MYYRFRSCEAYDLHRKGRQGREGTQRGKKQNLTAETAEKSRGCRKNHEQLIGAERTRICDKKQDFKAHRSAKTLALAGIIMSQNPRTSA